jgi:hypothetical protein
MAGPTSVLEKGREVVDVSLPGEIMESSDMQMERPAG